MSNHNADDFVESDFRQIKPSIYVQPTQLTSWSNEVVGNSIKSDEHLERFKSDIEAEKAKMNTVISPKPSEEKMHDPLGEDSEDESNGEEESSQKHTKKSKFPTNIAFNERLVLW